MGGGLQRERVYQAGMTMGTALAIPLSVLESLDCGIDRALGLPSAKVGNIGVVLIKPSVEFHVDPASSLPVFRQPSVLGLQSVALVHMVRPTPARDTIASAL